MLNMSGFGRVAFHRFVPFGHSHNHDISLYIQVLRECTSASAELLPSLKRIPILFQTVGEKFRPLGAMLEWPNARSLMCRRARRLRPRFQPTPCGSFMCLVRGCGVRQWLRPWATEVGLANAMRDVDRSQAERRCSGMNYKVQNGLIMQSRFPELAVALAILTLATLPLFQASYVFIFSGS